LFLYAFFIVFSLVPIAEVQIIQSFNSQAGWPLCPRQLCLFQL